MNIISIFLCVVHALLLQVLESEEQDNEAKFRAMVALGTMVRV